jgi:UDP-N-acetylglucosamine diphosphorylase / glucose-1-phosphate thymidylyltransferase / UDP-N-acetylgalactosamine diphosphorylase / glucosamine-1-phosphate N-acetyltransferase / galactosamine-1-phosphate N-acetyltransferase
MSGAGGAGGAGGGGDLFFYDDAVARTFEPFALTRPTCELRAGALLLRERWERALGMHTAGAVSSAHLADFDEPWGAGVVTVGGSLPAGSVLVNSRCAVALAPIAPAADVWRCDGRIAAVKLARELDVEELASGKVALEKLASTDGRRLEVHGRWIDHVWDFIGHLPAMLTEDIAALATVASRTGPTLGIIGGSHAVFADDGATIEPQVYFDTTAGPVLVRRGATVQAFTRIAGPCVVGAESLVGGDKISGSAIGDTCKVHGEVSSTIFLGHANKGHDGFVGHSYLGRWVNLGAGTITSNLKNTYGTVQFWTPEGEHDTGLQFLGTFLGDHAKTGIGTSLTTGTVIGAGANIYGSAAPPKVIPPFAWGEQPPYSTYRMDKFIEVAARVMKRRHVELSPRQMKLLAAAFDKRWSADKKR